MKSFEEKIAALRDEINSCGLIRPVQLANNKYPEILDVIHEKISQCELMLIPSNSNLQTHVIYGIENDDESLRRRTIVTADVEFLWIDVANGETYGPFHSTGKAKADFEDAALKAYDQAEWNHLSNILSLTCN